MESAHPAGALTVFPSELLLPSFGRALLGEAGMWAFWAALTSPSRLLLLVVLRSGLYRQNPSERSVTAVQWKWKLELRY